MITINQQLCFRGLPYASTTGLMTFENIRISIDFSGLKINGWLSGTSTKWSFRSLDPFFLRHCAEGVMHSAGNYGKADENEMQQLVFHAISGTVAALHKEDETSIPLPLKW